nr:MAG TPA: hypothetical protein [Caudoviricetes sp.]
MRKRLIHYIVRSFFCGFSVCLVCLSVHQKYSKRVQNTRTS